MILFVQLLTPDIASQKMPIKCLNSLLQFFNPTLSHLRGLILQSPDRYDFTVFILLRGNCGYKGKEIEPETRLRDSDSESTVRSQLSICDHTQAI